MNGGSLSAGTLGRVLRDIVVARETGTLILARGDERVCLRLQEGQIVGAESNVAALQLGRTLAALGLLSADEAAKAEAKAEQERKPLHRLLLERVRVEGPKLDEARKEHVRGLVQAAARWNEGTYALDPTAVPPTNDDAVPGLQTGDLILEATRAVEDPDVVRFALGDVDRLVVQSTDPLLRFQKITLKPTEGYLLSRVDGTLNAREVIQLAPGSAEEAEACLYGLYCAGLVDFLELTTRSSRPAKAPAAGAPASAPPPGARPVTPVPQTSEPAPRPPSPTQPPNAAPPAAPAPAVGAPGAPPDGEAQKLRAEVLDLHRELTIKNHFEILGIPRTANDVQVKEAYFQRAKRFHPDVHRSPELGDLHDQIQAIFIRLGAAFEILKDPVRRAQYETTLGSSRVPAEAPAPAAGPPAVDTEAEAKLAEDAVRKAEKLFTQEKYWDAIQLVELHLSKARGKFHSRARVVLAKCYLKNPNWVKRAEEQLLLVVDEDPKYVEAHFLLGSMYLSSGLKARALSKFKKVVELAPDHEEAKALVAEMAPEPPPEPPPNGGIVKRLFGKGS